MSQELLYWQALNRAMDHEMAADESVFTLGEDVGLYGGSYRVTEGLYAFVGDPDAVFVDGNGTIVRIVHGAITASQLRRWERALS